MGTDAQSPVAVNPWTAIWWRPQAALNAVVQRGGGSYTLLLAALMGIATLIGSLLLASNLHWFALIAGAVVAGPLVGLVGLYVEGAVLSWTGRPLGGRASQDTLRTAVAWAALPNIAMLLIVLGALAVFQQKFVRASVAPEGVGDPVLLALTLIVALLPLWGIVLRIRTVGAAQRFGVIRATANVAASILVLLAVALAVRILLFQPFVIPGSSMEPAVLRGDDIFVDKRSYGYSRYSFPFDAGFENRFGSALPARGDIVVFRLPGNTGIDYVKRVIGLPGDEIVIEKGVLRINGNPVPKVATGTFTSQPAPGMSRAEPAFEETLPGGRKFTVLEGEPDGPYDNAGPFKVPSGHYFMLGDNRDNSMDSRSMQQVGFIPADNIIGRVAFIYFSAGEPTNTSSAFGAFDNIRWHRLFTAPK